MSPFKVVLKKNYAKAIIDGTYSAASRKIDVTRTAQTEMVLKPNSQGICYLAGGKKLE